MLKVAVIGLGWWGRIIVDVLANNPKLQVVRVVDIGAAGQAFAQERSLPFSPRFEDALLDPQVQGVVLCTPHTLHTDQIVAAAQAGKHVFCEKPLSMTRADVLRACAAVDRAGVALAVGHEKRFEPPILELMQLLKSGALGTPLQLEANFSQDKFLALQPDNWRLSAHGHRHSLARLVDWRVWRGPVGLHQREATGQSADQWRHPGRAGDLQARRSCAHFCHPRYPICWPLRGVRLPRLGRGAR